MRWALSWKYLLDGTGNAGGRMHTQLLYARRPLALGAQPEQAAASERKRMLKNIIMHGWHPAASAHGSHGKRARCAIKKGSLALHQHFIFPIAPVFHFILRVGTVDLIA
jgi:hypothetical protein